MVDKLRVMYDWALKHGFSDATACALNALVYYIEGGEIEPLIKARWQELRIIREDGVLMDKDAVVGKGTAWAQLGRLYEGKIVYLIKNKKMYYRRASA